MRAVGLVIVFGIAGIATGRVDAAEVAVATPPVAGMPLSQANTAPPGASANVAGFGSPIASVALEKLSGGSDVSNDMTLNGTVSNNSTDNTSTGFNSIASGSFSGAAGLPMVIQNSGNGVLIQNATIINVQFKP